MNGNRKAFWKVLQVSSGRNQIRAKKMKALRMVLMAKTANRSIKRSRKTASSTNPAPLWTKSPSDLKDEDYQNSTKNFIPSAKSRCSGFIWMLIIHSILTGVLYFPKVKTILSWTETKFNSIRAGVHYRWGERCCADFLMLLHGVLDSPDIPLNVSRSYLQSDGNVKKISAHHQESCRQAWRDVQERPLQFWIEV